MGATPRCIKCGYEFRGFMLDGMLGHKCPSCGAEIGKIVKFGDNAPTVDVTDKKALADAGIYAE